MTAVCLTKLLLFTNILKVKSLILQIVFDPTALLFQSGEMKNVVELLLYLAVVYHCLTQNQQFCVYALLLPVMAEMMALHTSILQSAACSTAQ